MVVKTDGCGESQESRADSDAVGWWRKRCSALMRVFSCFFDHAGELAAQPGIEVLHLGTLL